MDRTKARTTALATGVILLLASLAGGTFLWSTRTQSIAAESNVKQDFDHTLVHDRRKRTYSVHVPSGYDGQSPLPVVLVLHGGASNAKTTRRQTQMDAVSDRNGFLAVYPEGTGRLGYLTFNAGTCCGYAVRYKVDDVGFIEAVLDDLARRYKIDPRRVYATGMSNGAMLCYRLACEIPERIAAIAPVSGAMGVDGPRPKRAVPIIHFHGLLDQNAPFNGGVGENAISKIPHRSVPDTIRWWCDVNGCDPKRPQIEQRPDCVIEHFVPETDSGAEIIVYSLREGGHTWPGGVDVTPRLKTGKLIRSVDASSLAWEFFRRHSLP